LYRYNLALDDERESHHLSHHLSPKSGAGGAGGRVSQFSGKGKRSGLTVVSTKGMSASSTKGNSLRYVSGHGTSTRSRRFGSAENLRSDGMEKRATSLKKSLSGGDAEARRREEAQQATSPHKLINDKKMMQGGFTRDVDLQGGDHVVALPDDFKIHKIILDRLRATFNGGISKPDAGAVKGATAAEIAAAEMLFPSGDPTMETLMQSFSDKDWDDAHDLIKKIMVYVVSTAER
jgi:hypothetical protein